MKVREPSHLKANYGSGSNRQGRERVDAQVCESGVGNGWIRKGGKLEGNQRN